MILVKFHKLLHKYTKVTEHYLDINTYTGLSDAIEYLFPELFTFISESKDTIHLVDYNKKEVIDDISLIKDNIEEDIIIIYLVPSLYGSGKGFKQIAVGLGLAALGLGLGGVSFMGVNIGKTIFGFGISSILGGLISIFFPSDEPTTDSEDTRRGADMFEGLVNTTNSGIPVAIHYGHNRVGGQFISAYVKTIDHQREETVRVGDYV